MALMSIRPLLFSMILARLVATAQDPSAVLEGLVTDRLQGALAGATVTVTNERTGLDRKQLTTLEGTYAFPVLPVGDPGTRLSPGRSTSRLLGAAGITLT